MDVFKLSILSTVLGDLRTFPTSEDLRGFSSPLSLCLDPEIELNPKSNLFLACPFCTGLCSCASPLCTEEYGSSFLSIKITSFCGNKKESASTFLLVS